MDLDLVGYVVKDGALLVICLCRLEGGIDCGISLKIFLFSDVLGGGIGLRVCASGGGVQMMTSLGVAGRGTCMILFVTCCDGKTADIYVLALILNYIVAVEFEIIRRHTDLVLVIGVRMPRDVFVHNSHREHLVVEIRNTCGFAMF